MTKKDTPVTVEELRAAASGVGKHDPAWATHLCGLAADEIERLRAFAQAVMASWPDGGMDGGDLQDMAEKHGLLVQVQMAERCGESCFCAEYGEFPQSCYRKTRLLTGSAHEP